LFDSSLFQELFRADNQDRDRTRERDPEDGSSEIYLGGEPLVLFVDLVWVSSISSTMSYVDKSNEDISTIFNLILDKY
jgi:hypothetical protein